MAKHFLRRLADKLPVRFLKYGVNLWAPFVGAGIKITEISADFRLVKASMKLHWYNKNLVGTHFGGSIFSLTDAFYMMMLIRNLGKDYIVWDKAARIEFKKPGRSTLYVTFILSNEELEKVRSEVAQHEKYVYDRQVDVVDGNGEVVATVVKTLYVRQRPASDTQSRNEASG